MNQPTQASNGEGGPFAYPINVQALRKQLLYSSPIPPLDRPHYQHEWQYPWVHLHAGDAELTQGLLIQKWGDNWKWCLMYAREFFDPTGTHDIHDPMTCPACIANRRPGIGFRFDCPELVVDIAQRMTALKRTAHAKYIKAIEYRRRWQVGEWRELMSQNRHSRVHPEPEVWYTHREGSTVFKMVTAGPYDTAWQDLKPFDGTYEV